ncbi:MAG: DNA repair protein RecN [Andreesenia angusta]|nr:DNA repair protein RecN [Andreesenia angusta]
MIIELMVENFAIIDKININFSEGLNIITGETGTGKSIIIDAINLLLGNRADKSLIRYGKESSLIEASFSIPDDDKNFINMAKEYGIKIDADKIIVISRELHSNGRNISRINGRIVNLSILKSIGLNLLDIQGQNENQKLLKRDEQILILDNLIEKKYKILKEDIRNEYKELNGLKKKFNELDIDEMKKEREMEILNYQISEIEEASLKEGEDEELLQRYKLLEKSNDIKKVIFESEVLFNGDGYSDGIINRLYSIGNELSVLSEADKNLKNFSEEILNSYYNLEEISRDMSSYGASIDTSQEELDYISNRIDSINSLKRKYGNTISDINTYRDKMEEELTELENIDKQIEDIKKKINNISEKLLKKSEELSIERKRVAKVLKDKIESELNELNMKDSRFEVDFENREAPNDKGIDDIEFMLSANIGQPIRAINKVASGGELSRLMLAFKNIINEKNDLSTLIFDEIDTGISGRTAQLVGEKIYRVSKKNQVICITHLPQIAAMADHHFLINKELKDGMTTANIRELEYSQRIDEIARLTGGVSVTDSTKRHAENMLELSKKIRED